MLNQELTLKVTDGRNQHRADKRINGCHIKRSAEKIASRLGITESNVIKVDSYGQFITILRQQKKSKGRIERLFLHFHGHYCDNTLYFGDVYKGGKELGAGLAPYVASDALIHLMSCHSSYTYNPRIPAHNFKRILTGLKTDKTHKNSSFTIIGYNIAIQITKDGYVRPSLGDGGSNLISKKAHSRAKKIVLTERNEESNFEVIDAPNHEREENEYWWKVDRNRFKWEYKY